MKFYLTKDDETKFEELLVLNQDNIFASNYYIELLTNYKDELQKYFSSKPEQFSEENYVTYFLNKVDPNNHELKDFLIKIYRFCNDFEKNPNLLNNYFVNFSKTIKPIKNKNYELRFNTIKPYEAFLFDDLELTETYKEITHLGIFKEEYTYLEILKDGTPWMSNVPHEIKTMEKAIEAAKGNVLVLGLGLGYYPIMIAQKENVSTIDVIEIDQNIIDIYKQSFPKNSKINIIKADAFDYLKTNGNRYSYIFADLWHDEFDGFDMYINLLKIAKTLQNPNIFYWIESVMIAFARRCMVIYLYERYSNIQINYEEINEPSDQFILKIHQKYKNLCFNSFDEIKNFISEDNIKKIIVEL